MKKGIIKVLICFGFMIFVSRCYGLEHSLNRVYKEEIFLEDFKKHELFFKSETVAFDNQGNIYCLDISKNALIVFNQKGDLKKRIIINVEKELIRKVEHLEIFKDRLYIPLDMKICIYDLEGMLMKAIQIPESFPEGESNLIQEEKKYFVRLVTFTVDKNENIYYVVQLSPHPRQLREFPRRGRSIERRRLVNWKIGMIDSGGKPIKHIITLSDTKRVNSIGVDNNGSIYVVMTGDNKILKLDLDGNILFEFKGQENAPLFGPFRVAFDSQNNLYVSDNNHNNPRLAKYDEFGSLLREYLSYKRKGGSYARDLKIDKENNIYFADINNETIVKLDNNDNLLLEIKPKIKRKIYCSKIEIGDDGNVYIKDLRGGGSVFTPEGQFLPELNINDIQFNTRNDYKILFPNWRELDINEHEDKYIADCERDDEGNVFLIYRIQNVETLFGYDPEGKQLFAIRYETSHFPRLVDLEIDKSGYILVADTWDDTIKFYDRKGRFVYNITSSFVHEEADGLSGLADIAVDSDGNIYAVDRYANQVKKFILVK